MSPCIQDVAAVAPDRAFTVEKEKPRQRLIYENLDVLKDMDAEIFHS